MKWDKIALDISKAITLDTKVSKRALMLKLLNTLEDLVTSYGGKKSITRIWTLHKIRGSQVIFYDSDERAEPALRSKYKNIHEGLIGKTIYSERDYKIYNNTPKISDFVVGWEKCRSELIILVRDRLDKAVAVINIESDYKDDFFLDNNIEFNNELGRLLRLFSNHISVVFELEGVIRSSNGATNIIRSIANSKLETKQDLKNSLTNVSTWTSKKVGLIRSFLIVKDNENNTDNSLANSSILHTYNHLSFPEADVDKDFLQKIYIDKNIESYSRFPTKCSVSDLEDIFSEKVLKLINIFGYKTVNYLQSHTIRQKNSNQNINIILLSIYDKKNKVTLDKLEEIFNITIAQLTFYSNYREMKYQHLMSESISFLNKSAFSNEFMSSILNDTASYITKRTNSDICMIYLLVHEKYIHEEMKFFLGGYGGDISVDLTEKRLPAETIIGKMIKEDKPFYYSKNYFQCEDNSNILDGDLKSSGLKCPSLFSHLLYAKKRRPIGAIILFKENTKIQGSGELLADCKHIKKYMADLSFHIGSIIQNKTLYYIDEILSKTYRAFFEEKNIEERPSIETDIDKFQYKINSVIKKALGPISEPIFFTIYRRDGKKFKQLSRSGLRENLNIDPPSFDLNDGLTGSVMFQPSHEIFVPYVEDIKIDIKDDPSPAIQCRNYWDYLIGDHHRFYYGKHFRFNKNQDYILLIIGQRKQAFYPSIAYKILLDIIQNIGEQFEKLILDTDTGSNINKDEEIEVFKLYSNLTGLMSEAQVKEIVEFIELVKSSDGDKNKKREKFSKYIKGISETTKEGKNFTDNAISLKDNVEQIYGWLATLL